MASYKDLRDKVVLVTGANGGMGLAITTALIENGALVVASDIAEVASPRLTAQSGVTYVHADIANEQAVSGLINAVSKRHGRFDCAVNAAAIEFETVPLAECETADFDRIMAINLRGLFLCMKYELRAMLAQSSDCAIVNLASTTSFQPGRIQPAYTASKHGVVGLTRQAAMDYASQGIRINAIAPGNIETPMLASALERRGIEGAKVQKMMPLRRFGRPEEIAEAVLWLCSNASSFTTGHVLAVEGGMLNT
jgi:NAD(P)-dependent dehydrogenase (short-subunit alcohol dehydrogenase family)